MFLFVKQCFAVIDAKRLSPLHTSLTEEDGEAFVKKTAPEAAWSCHLFADFCIVQTKSGSFPSGVWLGKEK